MESDSKRDQKGRFVNPHVDNIRRKITDFFLWAVGYYRDLPYDCVPEGFSYPLPDHDFDPNKPWAMWIGHSTYLISIEGRHILTDPIWSKRCSPLPLCGPKRIHPPAKPLSELPKIDYVLISHDHYDHLDKPTVEALHQQYPEIIWIVPKGVKGWFLRQGIERVVELNWWEEIDIDSAFKITAVPTQHFSGRKSTNLNKTLWVGYVVQNVHNDKSFYFVGDTGYNAVDFKKIGEKFDKIDLSLIPIGSYSPRKFMAPVHVEPKDAVQIHEDVGSNLSLAMHWKTFRLSEEPIHQPPFDLYRAMRAKDLNPHQFLAPDPGYKINW